jgi:dTDP-4-amino-4,6-dideoxygalactose transaminase
VFVDIDPVYFTMDPSRIEAAITPRTRAIVPVHLYGQAADMRPILDIAKRHRLIVIEDAAQAHGAEYEGARCGSMGDIAAFSFYPGKNLGAYGEGGAAVTNNPEYARMIRVLRNWGQEQKYEHKYKAFNYRMDGIQGAVLRVKLRHLEAWTAARRAHAAAYGGLLNDGSVETPAARPGSRHVYHVYAIRSRERDRVQAQLRDRGIETGIHYPIPLHLQPAHADLGHSRGDFPNAERAAAEVLSLPMFAELTDAQLDEVATAVRTSSAAPA